MRKKYHHFTKQLSYTVLTHIAAVIDLISSRKFLGSDHVSYCISTFLATRFTCECDISNRFREVPHDVAEAELDKEI